MKFTETALKGLYLIEPKVFEDKRGHFFESFNRAQFEAAGLFPNFVQDNQSLSQSNVLRGIHFQLPPHSQGKLVRVITGAVLDVAVDLRADSDTYGHHLSIELSAKNKKMLYVPSGFGHGFLTLEDNTIFSYKCTDLYHPEAEAAIMWNDEDLQIDWGGVKDPVISEKDSSAQSFKDFKSPFRIQAK